LSSAQAALDRKEIAPLYSFSIHVSTLLALPLAGVMMLLAADMLTGFPAGAASALPVVLILLAARGIEAAIGPATPIVEMVGHRGLPLFNSLVGMAIWIAVGTWLVPQSGALGMAIAVSAAVIFSAFLAVAELYVSDKISPFGLGFWRALTAAAMAIAALWALGEMLWTLGQRGRALSLLLLFWPVLWCTLKWGMLSEDKKGLGKLAQKLRLL
jgi:O-antigen/teichoic acid export membrane protein